MKYLVIKSTKTAEGDLRPAVITAYDTMDKANQAYFTACAEASVTGLGMYAVKMVTDELGEVTNRVYVKNNL